MSPNVIWTPLPGSQQLVLTCPYDECLYEGTRGPGKTDTILMDFAQHVGQGYGSYWRGIIFRREYKNLDDIVTRSKRWFRQIFPGARWLGSKGDYRWVFPDGEELLFRTFKTEEDYWNYHGHEYPFIGWEELTSWSDLTGYEAMRTCNRTSFRPQQGQQPIPLKIRATTNPYGRGHNAVKKYFISPMPAGVPFTENGRTRVRIFGSLSENPYVGQKYINNIKSITDPNKRAAWLNGSWDITAGGVLDDLYDESVHVIEPFDIPYSWRIKRCLDWGTRHPFSVGWWAVSDGTEATLANGSTRIFPPGTYFRIAEWYGWNGSDNEGMNLTAKKAAEGILEREANYKWGSRVIAGAADGSIYAVTDDLTVADNMEAVGVEWVKADKRPGSRLSGLDKLREMLEASLEKPMEDAGIFVFNTCRKWIELVPIIPRCEKNPADADSKAEDHNYDETRYAITEPNHTTTLQELPW